MEIPQALDHHWLATDPTPQRYLFRPGTREYEFDFTYRDTGEGLEGITPSLPGAARAYLEQLLPVQQAWAYALAEAAAPIHAAQQRERFGPPPSTLSKDWAARHLARYDIGDGNPLQGGLVDAHLGPFLNPYPGLQLRDWAAGKGPVAGWALAVSDATDPEKSRSSRSAAGRRATDLRPTATTAWDSFRSALDAWAGDAREWIEGETKPSAPTSRRRNSWR